MPKFNAGDNVVWSHAHGALHAEGSVLKKTAVIATANEEGVDVQFGSIVGPANDEETWFEVALEGGESRVLTGDELVRVAPEE